MWYHSPASLFTPLTSIGLGHRRLDNRNDVGTSINLARAGVHDSRFSILVLAGFEHAQRSERVDLQVAKGILHGLDVAHVSREIEDISLAADKAAHEFEIADVAFHDLNVILDGLNVEVIGAAGGVP